MPREATNKLVELAEAGVLNWEGIARECLQRMPEDDVQKMAEDMDWLPEYDGFYGD